MSTRYTRNALDVTGIRSGLRVSERTRAGAKAARGRGVELGRKPKLTPQQIDHARKMIGAGGRREDVADPE